VKTAFHHGNMHDYTNQFHMKSKKNEFGRPLGTQKWRVTARPAQ